MTKDYKVTYMTTEGKETNWCTLAGSITTAIAHTERFSDCAEVLSVEVIGESLPEDSEAIKTQAESLINEG